MKKIFLSVIILLSVCVSVVAQSKMSAYSRAVMNSIQTEKMNINENRTLMKSVINNSDGEVMVDAFIEIKEMSAIEHLQQMGVKCGAVIGTIVTANVPVAIIEDVVSMDAVKCLEIAKKARLKNDVARKSTMTRTDLVHSGENLAKGYTGDGVIYGTLDSGVDFNHIAFKNDDGSSRILYAYLPSDYSGTSVSGNMYDSNGVFVENGTLPGSEYSNEQISSLTTDYKNLSHGTHTIGIGAGGYMENSYYGMAPNADIIACASYDITEVSIVNSVLYIFNKAKELGKPAVVNLSLGMNVGPHDGTSFVSRTLDQLSGAGKIVVMSAGNEGDINLHVSKEFVSEGDELKTFFCLGDGSDTKDYKNLNNYYYSYDFDIWSRSNDPFTMNLIVYSKSTGNILYTSPDFVPSKEGNSYTLQATSGSAQYKYIGGSITLIGSHNGSKYNVYGAINAYTKSTDYRLGMIIKSAPGTMVDAWTDCYGLEFNNDGVDGFETGTPEGSINEWVTGESVISVGAYVSRKTWPNLNGTNSIYTYGTLNDLVPFSSYGPDANDIVRPDVTAPGFFLISSVSSYDNNYESGGLSYSELSENIEGDGRNHKWGLMYGTSMSSPCAAGIIATWLEAYPELTPADVKNILAITSKSDSKVEAGGEQKWGAGKIDAYAGIQEVLKLSSVDGAVRDEARSMLMSQNPNNGVFSIVVPDAAGNVMVNIYDMSGSLVVQREYENISGGESISIDISSQVTPGIYLLQAVSANIAHSARLLIK